jgi:hypothetical protein
MEGIMDTSMSQLVELAQEMAKVNPAVAKQLSSVIEKAKKAAESALQSTPISELVPLVESVGGRIWIQSAEEAEKSGKTYPPVLILPGLGTYKPKGEYRTALGPVGALTANKAKLAEWCGEVEAHAKLQLERAAALREALK